MKFMNALTKIEQWYSSYCDGDWEHVFGIKIETLDNPGWMVKIDLLDTKLVNISFSEIIEENGDDDWMRCRIRDSIFYGFGDPFKLEKILVTFMNWVESNKKDS